MNFFDKLFGVNNQKKEEKKGTPVSLVEIGKKAAGRTAFVPLGKPAKKETEPTNKDTHELEHLKGKSQAEIIEEIHQSFYDAVNGLLEYANIKRIVEPEDKSIVSKAEKLKELGFSSSSIVRESEQKVQEVRDVEYENQRKQFLKEAIHYFSFHYPNQKFITEESVKGICSKYGLVFGSADRYTGTIPDKNIEEISNFKLKEEDQVYTYDSDTLFIRMNPTCFSKKDLVEYLVKYHVTKSDVYKEVDGLKSNGFFTKSYGIGHSFTRYTVKKCGFEIVATAKDFNLTDAEIKDFKILDIVKEDPIVLHPVLFEREINGALWSKKYYLVVSAWGGPEATDELVVNNKMN